jgi:hypothetical protein
MLLTWHVLEQEDEPVGGEEAVKESGYYRPSTHQPLQLQAARHRQTQYYVGRRIGGGS